MPKDIERPDWEWDTGWEFIEDYSSERFGDILREIMWGPNWKELMFEDLPKE